MDTDELIFIGFTNSLVHNQPENIVMTEFFFSPSFSVIDMMHDLFAISERDGEDKWGRHNWYCLQCTRVFIDKYKMKWWLEKQAGRFRVAVCSSVWNSSVQQKGFSVNHAASM